MTRRLTLTPTIDKMRSRHSGNRTYSQSGLSWWVPRLSLSVFVVTFSEDSVPLVWLLISWTDCIASLQLENTPAKDQHSGCQLVVGLSLRLSLNDSLFLDINATVTASTDDRHSVVACIDTFARMRWTEECSNKCSRKGTPDTCTRKNFHCTQYNDSRFRLFRPKHEL